MFRPDDSYVPVFGPGDDNTRRLHQAVYEGDLPTVERCVKRDGVNPSSQLGHSVPLVLAVARGFNAICQFLIDEGADVNFGGKSGRLPLYLAAKLGNQEAVEMLLKAKANVALPFMTGNTALLAATSEGHEEIVRVLLDAGSDPLTRNNSGSTGLHLAAYQRNVNLVKMFLKAGVNVNMIQRRGKNVLLSTEGHRGTTSLHLACTSPEEDETGCSFITQCHDVLGVLLEAGADVNAMMENGRTPLHLAASKNCTTIARILIHHGCQVDPISTDNEEQKTPLHRAVDLGHVDMVRSLIDAGADVNFRDHLGVTPIFKAVFTNNLPMTALLVQAGSDLNSPTNNHSTPFIASLRHEPIITQMLLLGGCQGRLSDYTHYSWQRRDGDREKSESLHNWILACLENPRPLQQCCRQVARENLLPLPNTKLHSLPVPHKIQAFLSLSELDSLI